MDIIVYMHMFVSVLRRDRTAAAINDPNALSTKCVSLLTAASKEIGHVNLYNIYGDWLVSRCMVYPMIIWHLVHSYQISLEQ